MRTPTCNAHPRQHGFTMVELVVSLVVSSVLMGMIAMIIGAPVDSYMEQRRRSELVDASDRITRVLANDLAGALPNSVRMRNSANISVLQMLEVTDIAFYVPEPLAATQAQADEGLSFLNSGDQFIAYGRFDNPHGTTPPLLVVGHTGTNPNNAYNALANNVMIANANVDTAPGMNGHAITLNAGSTFSNASATNRIFAIRAPITYVCNRTTGRLQRFTDHAFAALPPANESAVQLNSPGTIVSTLATGVSTCNVACTVSTNFMCQSTVTLSLTLTRGAAPNISTLRVFHQAAVENRT